jgi:hypothetical protein
MGEILLEVYLRSPVSWNSNEQFEGDGVWICIVREPEVTRIYVSPWSIVNRDARCQMLT